MKYEYTIGLQGLTGDVNAIRHLLDRTMEALYLAEARTFELSTEDEETLDIAITYTTEKHFTRAKLDKILDNCYIKTDNIRDWNVNHGEWIARRTI